MEKLKKNVVEIISYTLLAMGYALLIYTVLSRIGVL